jgi:type IV secretion system protein VirD4
MEKEVLSIRRKRLFSILSGLPPLLFALLYGGGYIAQFIRNHTVWKNAGGTPGYGTAPEMPSFILSASFEALFTLPYGIIGGLICISVLVLLIIMVMRMKYGDTGKYDKERNFIYFPKRNLRNIGFYV